MLEINKIYNADCLELMKQLPDKCVDLVLTDPPYGIIKGIKLNGMDTTSTASKWDFKPDKEYFDEIFRISKNQIIWGMQYFTDYIEPSKGVIFWDKKNGENFMSDGELAYNTCTNAVRIFRYAKIGKDNYEPIRYHPTQKPLRVSNRLFLISGLQGGNVLIPFLGSGTEAVAAIKYGMNPIGFEIGEDYFDVANKRIQDELLKSKQSNLFETK